MRKKGLPKSIESIVASVDLDRDGSSVGFGYTTIAFHDDKLGPDLVVDLMPFVQNLLDVILIGRKRKWKKRLIKNELSGTMYGQCI